MQIVIVIITLTPAPLPRKLIQHVFSYPCAPRRRTTHPLRHLGAENVRHPSRGTPSPATSPRVQIPSSDANSFSNSRAHVDVKDGRLRLDVVCVRNADITPLFFLFFSFFPWKFHLRAPTVRTVVSQAAATTSYPTSAPERNGRNCTAAAQLTPSKASTTSDLATRSSATSSRMECL